MVDAVLASSHHWTAVAFAITTMMLFACLLICFISLRDVPELRRLLPMSLQRSDMCAPKEELKIKTREPEPEPGPSFLDMIESATGIDVDGDGDVAGEEIPPEPTPPGSPKTPEAKRAALLMLVDTEPHNGVHLSIGGRKRWVETQDAMAAAEPLVRVEHKPAPQLRELKPLLDIKEYTNLRSIGYLPPVPTNALPPRQDKYLQPDQVGVYRGVDELSSWNGRPNSGRNSNLGGVEWYNAIAPMGDPYLPYGSPPRDCPRPGNATSATTTTTSSAQKQTVGQGASRSPGGSPTLPGSRDKKRSSALPTSAVVAPPSLPWWLPSWLSPLAKCVEGSSGGEGRDAEAGQPEQMTKLARSAAARAARGIGGPLPHGCAYGNNGPTGYMNMDMDALAAAGAEANGGASLHGGSQWSARELGPLLEVDDRPNWWSYNAYGAYNVDRGKFDDPTSQMDASAMYGCGPVDSPPRGGAATASPTSEPSRSPKKAGGAAGALGGGKGKGKAGMKPPAERSVRRLAPPPKPIDPANELQNLSAKQRWRFNLRAHKSEKPIEVPGWKTLKVVAPDMMREHTETMTKLEDWIEAQRRGEHGSPSGLPGDHNVVDDRQFEDDLSAMNTLRSVRISPPDTPRADSFVHGPASA